jgi:hypothetical protein
MGRRAFWFSFFLCFLVATFALGGAWISSAIPVRDDSRED